MVVLVFGRFLAGVRNLVGDLFFHFAFERTEGLTPELFEIFAQSFKAGRVQLIQAAIAHRAVDHQVRLFQDAEVLRYRRAADREVFGQFPDGYRSVEQAHQDCAAGGIAEGVKLRLLVSSH
jgi:hypothetical protein